jgi:hypothetical protein
MANIETTEKLKRTKSDEKSGESHGHGHGHGHGLMPGMGGHGHHAHQGKHPLADQIMSEKVTGRFQIFSEFTLLMVAMGGRVMFTIISSVTLYRNYAKWCTNNSAAHA